MGKDNLVTIETAPVLGVSAKSLGKARSGYLKFIAEGKATGHQAFLPCSGSKVFGDERFIERIEERVEAIIGDARSMLGVLRTGLGKGECTRLGSGGASIVR